MGHPVPPLVLLMLLMLHPTAPSSPCFSLPSDAPTKLDLANHSLQNTQLDWSLFHQQRQILLSHNGIKTLSPSSRAEPGLEELDLSHNQLQELPPAFLSQARGLRHLQLQHNRLRELPPGFFANATALQSLRLEGNPLPAVPPTAFQATLRDLVVSCRCQVVGSVLATCACSQPNCTVPKCHCVTSQRDCFNVTFFHARECQGSVGLVAGLSGMAGVVVLLVVVIAVVCYRRRKAAAVAAGTGRGKRESAVAHGQPRYISRADEIDAADGTAAAPDYENIFVNPCSAPATVRGWTPGWKEKQYSPQVPVDDDYFLESEAVSGDQPIYANTQWPGEDSIYIIPGQ